LIHTPIKTEFPSFFKGDCQIKFELLHLITLSACGTLTGLPTHGGGKRFAIEQELVAAATRSAIEKLDLSLLRGKKVCLFVNAMGDSGAGNLLGGRMSFVSQLRGDYLQTPETSERMIYPRVTSHRESSTTESSSTSYSTGSDSTNQRGSSSQSETTESLHSSPTNTSSQQKGAGTELIAGVDYEGLGAFQTSMEITSDDLRWLVGILQSSLFLRGALIVPPSEAELDVFVVVDIFGTVRSRADWIFVNNEILKARTSLEIIAARHDDGKLAMASRSASMEAEYNEKFILWNGPISITHTLRDFEPLFSTQRKDKSSVAPKQAGIESPEH
jgi:hypothetical protein